MTQKELAEKTGLSIYSISAYVRGLRKPKVETKAKIYKELNIDAKDIDLFQQAEVIFGSGIPVYVVYKGKYYKVVNDD
nr:helix-turn-helix transcriptional regulator [Fructobacillus sp. CRL 2054]